MTIRRHLARQRTLVAAIMAALFIFLFPNSARAGDVSAFNFISAFAGSPIPSVNLSVPSTGMVGEDISFTVTFENAGALSDDIGYGPYIDVYLPATGADGDDGIGASSINATYLGQPVITTVLTFPPSGTVQHPYVRDNTGAYITVSGTPGDKLVTFLLPYGSYGPDQPPLPVNVTADMSDLADVGAPMTIRARGGFRFGATPIDDWCCGASPILSEPSNNTPDWPGSSITPTIMEVDKSYSGPENETATGPNFPRQYTLSVDIADGQTINNLVLTDVLPDNVQFIGIAASSPAGTATTSPSTTVPGGTLEYQFNTSVTGGSGTNDATLTIDFYIGRANNGGTAVIDPDSGDDVDSVNSMSGVADWTPIDSRDPASPVTGICPNCHTLTDKSIAIQKGVGFAAGGDTGEAGYTPGDTVEYTIEFQISDYFAFEDIVITDTLSDGQEYIVDSATLSIAEHSGGGLAVATFDASNINITYSGDGNGITEFEFNVSDEIIRRGLDGQLLGGCVPAGGTGGTPPDCDSFNGGGTTGTITFQAVILEDYKNTVPSGDQSVDHADPLDNDVVVAGDLLDIGNLSNNGNTEEDTSGAAIAIIKGTLTKSLYAINGSTTLPSPLIASPGDTITYRLQYNLPTSDTELLYFVDYLPLPIFDATEVTTFDDVTDAAPPAAGHAHFGPDDTFSGSAQPGYPKPNTSGIVPSIATDSGPNSVSFTYGTFDGGSTEATNVDILFTVTVDNQPFADELFLTNQAFVSETNSQNTPSTGVDLVMINLGQPVLTNDKAIVATSNPAAIYSPDPPAPVTFNTPGTVGPRWSGTIPTDPDNPPPINSDVANVNGGDLVTFAMIIHNSGSSLKGAFDIQLRDELQDGFLIPTGGAGLNLRVSYADGSLVPHVGLGGGPDGIDDTDDDLFGTGIQLVDPHAGLGVCQTHELAPEKSLIVITYDLQVRDDIAPNEEIINTGTLFNYAGTSGGPDHTPEDLTDTATVIVEEITATKGHTAPTHVDPQVTGGDYATIGEVYEVTLEITLPQGTRLNDNVPTLNYIEIIDTIQEEGVEFCDAADGCADPFITQSDTAVVPDTVDSPDAPDWWAEDNSGTGSEIRFFMEQVDNSGTVGDYTFTVTFSVRVTGLDDGGDGVIHPPAANDQINNSFIVHYFNQDHTQEFTTPAVSDLIDIDQPEIDAQKDVVRINRPGTGDLCNSAAACDGVTVQGNDILYYESVFTSSGETTAIDVSLIDWLPQYVTYNTDMTCSSDTAPAVNGGVVGTGTAPAPYGVELQIDTTPAGDWDLPPGNSISCGYSVTIDANVPAGTQLTNFTDADWSTLDGPVSGERIFEDADVDGDGSSNDDGTDDEAQESISVESPSAAKVRVTPTPTGPGTQPDVKIGDVITYEITIPLPIGRTQDLVINDALSPGLILYEGGTFTFKTNSLDPLNSTQTINGSNDGLDNEAPAFSVDWGLWDSACTPTGAATNCIYNDGVNNTQVTVVFQAIVADVPDNLDGVVLDNNMSATFLDGLGNSGVINDDGALDDEEVLVTEPHVSLTKTILPPVTDVDAGDTFIYQVVLTSDGTATAYDVYFEDNLDDFTDLDTSYTPVCTHSSTGALTLEIDDLSDGFDTAPDVLAANFDQFRVAGDLTEDDNGWDLEVGNSITCTYHVQARQDIVIGATLQNLADTDWSSQDGDVSGGATSPNEREYDDRDRDTTVDTSGDGTPDNDDDDAQGFPALSFDDDQDDAQIGTPTPSISKDRTSSDITVQPGEVVVYEVVIQVPEGITQGLVVEDTLPAGFEFVSANAPVKGWSGGPALPGFSTEPAAGDTGTLQWVFDGDVENIFDNNITNDTLTLSYNVRVTSAAVNTTTPLGDGDDAVNTAALFYTPHGGMSVSLGSDDASVDVIRPSINTTKSASVGTADGGDQVIYTVTITNNGPGDAYDVYFNENLDNFTAYDTAYAMTCTHSTTGALSFEIDDLSDGFDETPDAFIATLDTFRVAGDLTEDDNPWMLASGESITCEYAVEIRDDVPAGATGTERLRNVVSGRFDSADGDQSGEQNFSNNSNSRVETPAPTLDSKARLNPVPGAEDTVQPGDTVTYEVVVTVPEGRTLDLKIQDTLPAGFEFVSAVLTSGWGAVLTPSSAPSAGDTGLLSWEFSPYLENPGDNLSNDTVTITYTVRVLGSAASTAPPLSNGDDTVNTAEVLYTPRNRAETSLGTDTAEIDVVRPEVTVTKSADVGIADAGNQIVYTITVENASPPTAYGTAYDVYFDEDLDLDDSTDFDTSYAMTCTHSTTGALTFEMDDLSDGFDMTPDAFTPALDQFRIAGDLDEDLNPWVLAGGESITCQYAVVVRDDVVIGEVIENGVRGTIDSADGDTTGEEEQSDDASSQVGPPAPSLAKTRTSASDTAQAGDIVSYEIVVTLPEGQTDELIIQDTLPAGFEFVSGSVVAGWGGIPALPALTTEPSAGDSGTLTWVFDAPVANVGDNLPANDTLTLAYNVRVLATASTTSLPLGDGDDAVNTAEVFYTPQGGSSTSVGTDTAAVDVIEPEIEVAKSVSPAAPALVDAGDVLQYTVVVTNNGPGIAYDVYFDDVLDGFTGYAAATLTCTFFDNSAGTTAPTTFEQGAPFTIAGTLDELTNHWDLDVNDNITCTYDVVLAQDVPAADQIVNHVVAYGDTSDGNVVGEKDVSTPDVSTTVETAEASIIKANDASAPEYQADDSYIPGQLVPYVTTITLPEGAIHDLLVCDALPAGLNYDSTTAVINSDGLTYTAGVEYDVLTAGFPADCPAGTDVAFQFATSLVLDDVANTDNNTPTGDFKTITITYLARLMGTVNDGDVLQNTATLVYTRGSDGSTATADDDEAITAEVVTQDTDKAIITINRGGTDLCTSEAACNGITILPGDVLTYDLELTNTHATAVGYEAELSDDLPLHLNYNGDLTCELLNPAAALATNAPPAGSDPLVIDSGVIGTVNIDPAQTLRCTYTATVQNSIPAGFNLTNTVTGTVTTLPGTPTGEAAITDTGTDTAVATEIDLELDKSVDNATPTVGGTIIFTLTLTNQGPDTATKVSVHEALPDGYNLVTTNASQGSYDDLTGIWNVGDLTGGQTETLTLEVIVLATGTHTNYAQVIGADQLDIDSTSGDTSSGDDDDDTQTIDIMPTVTVTKSASPTAVNESGGTVTYTIEVENTSAEDVTLTALTDDIFGDLDGQGTCAVPQTIALGATYTCTFDRFVTGDFGTPHTNTVTAVIDDGESNTASDTDDATVTFNDTLPSINVTKTPGVANIDEPGGTVTFTVEVENTQAESVILTGLTDDVFGNLSGQGTCAVPQTIPGGSSYTCTFDGSISGNAGDTHTNTITATANDDESNVVSDTGSATVTFNDALPSIAVSKTPSVATVNEPGGMVIFTVEVENTSLEELTLTTLDDDIYGDLDGQGTCSLPQTIASGATYTCTFDRFVTGNPGDIHTNTVTASAEDDEGNTGTNDDNATVTIIDAIAVTKTASVGSITETSGLVTFTVEVENLTGTGISLYSLVDDIFGDLNGQGTCSTPQTIGAGATYTCSFDGTVTGNAGDTHTNTVTATITDGGGNAASDEDDADVSITDVAPTINLTKSVSVGNLNEPGGTVTFTVEVENTSPEGITLTGLTDDIFGDLDGQGTCAVPQTIASGATYTCTFDGSISGNAGDGHTNTITATANDDESNVVSDTDDATVTLVDVLPTLNVTKTESTASIGEPGGTITFTVNVENTSPEAVTLTALTDDIYGDLDGQGTCSTPQTIAAGATYTCAFDKTVSGDPGDTHTNTVTATINDDESNTASGDDDATVTITDVLPTITVIKSAAPTTINEPGGTITFTVEVQNTSTEAITLTALVDDIYGDLNGQGSCVVPQAIAIGGSYNCTFDGAVNGADGTTHTNTVTATAEDDETNTATGDDDAVVTILDAVNVSKTASVGSLNEPGGMVTFTVEVENPTGADVTLTSLVDDIYGDLNGQGTCATPQTITAGATYTCAFDGMVNGLGGTSHTNTITATVTDGGGNTASESDDATVSIVDLLPTIAVAKTPGVGTINEPGGLVTFTVEVQNTSSESVTLTGLTDDIFGNLNGQGTCATPQTITAGATYTCTFDGMVSGNAGDVHTNTVTATASDDEGNNVNANNSANVNITDVFPSIAVTKSAGVGSLNEPGGTVSFTVEVRNTSPEPVTLTDLTDSVYGNLNAQGTCAIPQTIGAGGTYTCSFNGLVSGNPGDTHTNTVTATANDDESNTTTDDDSATVIITDVAPTISVNKTASPTSISEPGGTVAFTVEVRNTSPEPVTLTALVDSVYGNLSGQGTCSLPQSIGIGGIYTCTFNGAVSGNAGDVHTNIVTATVNDDESNTSFDTDDASVVIGDFSLLTLDVTKTASPTSISEPGGTVSFTVEVRNTSPEALTLTALTDDVYGNLSGQGTCSLPQLIPVGSSYTCTFNEAVSGNAGDVHTNTVTAAANDDEGNPVGDNDSANVNITDAAPSISVAKTALPTALGEPGGTVAFTVDVQNTSPEAVTLTSLVDSVYGDLNGQGTCSTPQTIAAGTTYTCTFNGTVNGSVGTVHTNTVTATANDDEANTTSGDDDASVTITDVLPTIAVTKSAGVGSVNEPGGTVTFTVEVQNTSPEPVTLSGLSDDVFGDLNGQGTCSTPQTIAVGTSYTCAFDGAVNGPGGTTHTNTVTAAVNDDEGNTTTGSDQAVVTITDLLPSITVTKTAGTATINEPGGTVTFTVEVQNTSTEAITLGALNDDIFGDLNGQGTCSVPQTIGVGAAYTCIFDGAVTGTGGDIHTNTVIATASDDEGNNATDDDDASVTLRDVIDVTKSPAPGSLPEVQGTVTFTVTVQNTAGEDITLTALTDDVYGDLNGQGTCSIPQAIAAGGNYVCTFDGTASGNAGSTHTNTITASVTDNSGNPASDTGNADVLFTDALPSLTVAKSASPSTVGEPGGTVTFTAAVENTSAEAVTLTALTDDIYGNLSGQGTCATPQAITPGATYTCTFDQVVNGNPGDTHTNTITATVQDDEGNSVSDTGSTTVSITEVLPTIAVIKSASPGSVNEPGGIVIFTVEVQNTSPEPVTLNTLSDSVFGNLNGQGTCSVPQTIDPGASYICAFDGTVNGDAADTHTNTVTATASDDEGNSTSGSDDAAVTINDIAPSITVTKTAGAASVQETGETVTFTVTVENTSFENITLTALTDDVYGDLDGQGTCSVPQTIPTGTAYSCTFDGLVSGDAGSTHINTITATAEDNDGTAAGANGSATITFTDVSPTITVTKSASTTSVVATGENVTFTVTVENTSQEEVTLTALSDSIYGNLNGQGTCAVPQTLTGGATYTCTFDQTVSGSAGTTHTNIVSATATDDEGNTASDDDNAVINIIGAADLELSKTVDNASPYAGQNVTFTLTLTNRGPSDTTNVQVTDNLPSGYRFSSAAASKGSYSEATGVWAVGDLANNETVTLRIMAVALDSGQHNNYAEVTTSDQPDPDSIPGNSSVDEDDDAEALVALGAVDACTEGLLYQDDNRNGIQDAGEPGLPDVRLVIYDSSGASVLEAVTGPTGQYDFSGLPSGTYSVEIDSTTLPSGMPIYTSPGAPRQEVTISVGSSCAAANFGLVLVDPIINKTGNPSILLPGETVVYTITAANPSLTTAISNVVVVDPLNGYLEYISATTTQGTYSYDAVTHTITFDLGTIAPNDTVTMTITARVSDQAPMPTTIYNQARLDYAEGPTQHSVQALVTVGYPAATTQTSSSTTSTTTSTASTTTSDGESTTSSSDNAASTSASSQDGQNSQLGAGSGSMASGPTLLPNTGIRPSPEYSNDYWLPVSLLVLFNIGALLLLGWFIDRKTGIANITSDQLYAMVMIWLLCNGLLLAALLPLHSGRAVPTVSEAAPSVSLSEPTPTSGEVTTEGDGAVSEGILHEPVYEPPPDPATHLVIPALGIDTDLTTAPQVDESWDISVFDDEIAHLEGTAHPGTIGNAVLAGHVTHLKGDGPFINLWKMHPGDLIIAEGDSTAYVYRVEWVEVVNPTDIEVTHPADNSVLTLITCTNWNSSRQVYQNRLIVRAELAMKMNLN